MDIFKTDRMIIFGDKKIPVYYDPEEDPYFRLADTGYSVKDFEKIEHDEYFKHNGEVFVTELGLYNLLSQDEGKNGRLWRRVVHEQLIDMRLKNGKYVEEQFSDWEQAAGDYYIDEDTGKMMRSVTVAGGDVIQEEV